MEFSDADQLAQVSNFVRSYAVLPFFLGTVPGGVMEEIVAHLHEGQRLNTYDFVDVVSPSKRCGWQVKSTKASTPVTWKRAKIEGSADLIRQSLTSDEACQELGRRIIDFCNSHAIESLERYQLEAIGYARLIAFDNRSMLYFEKLLITPESPILFHHEEFSWKWSIQKKSQKKEQLPALHGFRNGVKAFAWHGMGENQLHFTDEKSWWPSVSSEHAVHFTLPEERLTLLELIKLLSRRS